MRLVTFSIETPLGAINRIGALYGEQTVDLAAAYEAQLHHLGDDDAMALAAAHGSRGHGGVSVSMACRT